MVPVGRKLLCPWGDRLTLGFLKLTPRWSGFAALSGPGNPALLHDLVDVAGEVVARPIGEPSVPAFGRDPDGLVTTDGLWRPGTPSTAPAGLVGRRLLVGWGEGLVIGVDKVVGSPKARFDLDPSDEGLLMEMLEFDGDLVERPLGKPAVSAFGHAATELVVRDHHWLSVEEMEARVGAAP